MSITQVGDASIIWGTLDDTFGYVENLSESIEAKKDEIENGQGDVIALIYSNKKTSVTGSFTWVATDTSNLSSLDPVGKAIEIKTHGTEKRKIVIDKVKRTYKRAACCVIEFDGTSYPSITLA